MCYIAEYRSATEAARRIGVKFQGNIANWANNRLKSAYGFIWKYKDDINKPLNNEENDSNITTNKERELVRLN